MKKILFLILTMFSIITFTSCDKVNNDPDEPIITPGNLFDCTFTTTSDGCCILEGTEPISADVINDEVKGYGWKVIGMYEVQDNGKLSHTDFRKDMLGSGYTDYWFKSDSRLVGFAYSDAPGRNYDTTDWSYDATRGFILCGKANESIQNRYMQVLRFDKTELIYRQMYTMQQLGFRSDGNGNTKPFYGLVIYQRMTDSELSQTQKIFNYDANSEYTGAVPNDCKFRVSARYYNPDDFEEDTNGAVIVTFGKVEFTLTDHLGTAILPNPALEYFDSIVWRSNSHDLPDHYVIHRHKQGQAQTTVKWNTYFFNQEPNLPTVLEGYKNGRVVYTYEMQHNIYADKFLCYDWNIIAQSKPRDYTASCLLDKSRSFTVYVPRAYNDDISKPYAELRYNSEEKGKGNDVAILLKECQELADLMTKNYGKGTDIGKQVEHYRTLFYALPEKSDIKYYWETTDTRIALVYHHDDVNFNNEYYYIHAEPIQK